MKRPSRPRPCCPTFRPLVVCSLALLLTAVSAAAEDAARPRTMPITAGSEEILALYEEGERLIDSWRLDEARPIFERIVAEEPDFALGWVGLAWSQPRFKDMFEYADRALELLDQVEVSTAEELRVRAFHASLNSDPRGWQESIERLVELYPDDARAALLMGNVHMAALSDNEAALRWFRRAVELRPGFVVAWRRIGGMELLLGNSDEAGAAFRHAVELAPDDPRPITDLAEWSLQTGQVEAALEQYDRALALAPMFEDAERGIVTAWMLDGRHDDARRHLRSLYERAPHDGFRSGIHFALAVTHLDEGDSDRAIAELEANLELSAKIHDTLAMAIDLGNLVFVLLEVGRTDEAQVRSNELLKHILDDPAQPENRKQTTRATHLARSSRIALRRGDLAAAKRYAEQYKQRADELDRPAFDRLVHQLAGEIALAEERWDDALRELTAANPHTAGNMYRMAVAHRRRGDEAGYRRMLEHVVGYRGVLNLDYASVRRRAEARLRRLG